MNPGNKNNEIFGVFPMAIGAWFFPVVWRYPPTTCEYFRLNVFASAARQSQMSIEFKT
jgi:hypothetical protein